MSQIIFLYLKKFLRYLTCRKVDTPMIIIEMMPKTMTRDLMLSFWSDSCTSLATKAESSFRSWTTISFTLNA